MATYAVARMTLASVVCWAVVSMFTAGADRPAVAIGVLGPLVVASAAWVLMERAYLRAPESLSGLLIKLFAAKMVLFGAYVAAAVMLLPAGRIAFVISFTITYAVLHVMEALYLRRLFSGRRAA